MRYGRGESLLGEIVYPSFFKRQRLRPMCSWTENKHTSRTGQVFREVLFGRLLKDGSYLGGLLEFSWLLGLKSLNTAYGCLFYGYGEGRWSVTVSHRYARIGVSS